MYKMLKLVFLFLFTIIYYVSQCVTMEARRTGTTGKCEPSIVVTGSHSKSFAQGANDLTIKASLQPITAGYPSN